MQQAYDRAAEDLGNSVHLEHVNVQIPDQRIAGLFYVVGLIRDLDNPFEYRNGEPGAADVNLDVLVRSEDRLRALLGSLDATPAAPAAPAEPVEQ